MKNLSICGSEARANSATKGSACQVNPLTDQSVSLSLLGFTGFALLVFLKTFNQFVFFDQSITKRVRTAISKLIFFKLIRVACLVPRKNSSWTRRRQSAIVSM
jgi:hypothetical protein